MIVTAVSYLNTVPLIWGIKQAAPSLRATLSLAIPAICAQKFYANQTDIALIPIGALAPKDKNLIVTDFCISAEGYVDTVALFANCQLSSIKRVFLDSHSRTSIQLVRILARDKWGVNPLWIDGIPENLRDGDAIVAIGDKVFEMQGMFSQKWDLAHQWMEMTGLPFVFAVWVARPDVPKCCLEELNMALKNGVDNIDKAIEGYQTSCPDPKRYLTQNIKFDLTQTKRKAIELFWEKQITPG